MEDDAIESEYEQITRLAEQRWLARKNLEQAVQELKVIDKKIASISHYWIVDEYGIVDIGLGVC